MMKDLDCVGYTQHKGIRCFSFIFRFPELADSD
jgi:hypothetical protein